MITSLFSSFAGIEIRDTTVVVSCLKNDFSGIHVLSSRIFPLRDDDESIGEIKSFISRHMTYPAQAFVCVPYKWSMVKFIEIPSPKGKGKEALIQMMQFEIERHIPFQIEDMFYDVQVLERKEDTYRVLFAAAQRDKIEYVKTYLERLSLNPQIITLAPFALLNAIEYSGEVVGGWQSVLGITKKTGIMGQQGETSMVLLTDKSEVFLSMLKEGRYVHLKSFPANADDPLDGITQKIAAELAALHIENPGEAISKAMLMGSADLLSDISTALEEKIGLSVQRVDPLNRILKDTGDIDGYEVLASIGGCYAGFDAGQLKINLLPHKTDVATRKTGPMIARFAAIVILLLIIGIFAGEFINSRRLLAKVETNIKENEPDLKIIEQISSDINLLQQKRDFLSGRKEKDTLLDILAELTNIMPQDAWLTDFEYKEVSDAKSGGSAGELIVSGQASSSSALIPILENSPLLEKVEFVGPVTARGNKEGFKIKAFTVMPSPSPAAASQENRELKGKEAKESG